MERGSDNDGGDGKEIVKAALESEALWVGAIELETSGTLGGVVDEHVDEHVRRVR